MLDFSKMEKPEGLTDEMLNNDKVQAFITGLITSQKTAAVSQVTEQLNAATQGKAIADQKTADLRAELDTAKKVKPGDNKDNQAALDALQSQIDAKGLEITKYKTSLDRADVRSYLNGEIAAYNAANPTVKIVGGAESYVLDAALATFRKNDSGQIIPFDGDNVLTGQSGYMTGAEFIAKFRQDKPLFFEQPSGGGASGNSGGAGSKEMTRTDFEKLPPLEQGKAVQNYTIID